MADLKISQLNSIVTVVPATDVLPVVQGGTTLKITPKQILESGSPAVLSSATITGAATVGTTLGVTGALSAASLALSGAGAGFTATATSGNSLNQISRPTNATAGGIQFKTSSTNDWILGLRETGDSDFHLLSYGTVADVLTVARATGNVTISAGNVVMGTSGKGIDFTAAGNVAGMTSELLDDYEEGTWVPTDASGAGLTFTLANCRYTKVGRLVTVQGNITYPVTASTANATWGGFPFNSSDLLNLSIIYSDASVATLTYISSNSANAFLLTPGVNTQNVTVSGKFIGFSGTYMI